jgi:hypothetical protein
VPVIEVTPVDEIEGIDLGNTPPCQCLYADVPCRRPSAFRIFSICGECGHQARCFVCGFCHDNIKVGNGICSACQGWRGITAYC